jgi:hypothetical protein
MRGPRPEAEVLARHDMATDPMPSVFANDVLYFATQGFSCHLGRTRSLAHDWPQWRGPDR